MHANFKRVGFDDALGFAVSALVIFGVGVTVRATWVIAHGGDRSFDNAFNYPGWSTMHFVPALVFSLILPFQLWPGSRRRFPRLHRIGGRVAGVAGVLFSLTGLILPYAMPARPFGERAFMTAVSCFFLLVLGRGVAAARRRDFVAHRRWMLRVTALSMGPLTQRVIFPFFAAAGIDSMMRFWDLFMTAAWFSLALNVVIAEWWIRRATARSAEARVIESGIAVAVLTS